MNDIAQARIRKARAASREADGGAREKVPFRNGNLIATLYAVVFAAVALGLKQWLGSDGVLGAAYRDATHCPVFDSAIVIAMLFAARSMLKYNSPDIIRRNSRLSMLVCACVLDLLFVAFVLFMMSRGYVQNHFGITAVEITKWTPLFMPVLFAPALVTLLTDFRTGRTVAFCIALTHIIFAPVQAAIPVALMCMIPSFVKLRHVSRIRRRSQLLAVFVQGTLPFFLCSLILIPAYNRDCEFFALPVFEHVFAACSNIKLSNYADLEHPLLRNLSNDAPGTYQHSVKVADLAFEAAERIGANPLLCRVGGYFHDIGKVDNPRYFGENLAYGEQNPHDKLPPSMSASILEAHIKQGLAHADGNTFPPELRRMIKEHHGTTVKEYFLFKSREQAKLRALETGDDPDKVEESSFRYNSDKPSTRETGILLLADSVEAATRSLETVTPQSISNLVEDIAKKKINDGQFDECPLSFTEINTIKKSFIVTLQHILHQRIAYPREMPANGPDNTKPPAKPAN